MNVINLFNDEGSPCFGKRLIPKLNIRLILQPKSQKIYLLSLLDRVADIIERNSTI